MTTFAPISGLAARAWRTWLSRSIVALLAASPAVALAVPLPPVRPGHPVPVHIAPRATPHARPAENPVEIEFRKFVAELWPRAEARGVSRKTFDAAFNGVTFDSNIIAFTKAQPEFVKPIWEYLQTAVSNSRIQRGRAKAAEVRAWLAKAKTAYGVDESVIMGIWGMETEFGAFEGSDNVIRALASLAFVHFRGDYFRDELIAALHILQEGDIAPGEMRGSWAGAMGQTQFMPSSFNEYAVDFEGHGRRDIWNSAPDAIGSTANYLAKHGWAAGPPWGFEVRLPRDFKLTDADSTHSAPFSSFAERGVVRADGGELPRSGEAQLLIPAGLNGPVFLVTGNFQTIKSYNNSTAYALGVALLGDAITQGRTLQAAWPVHDPLLSEREVRDLQTRLRKLGYDVGAVDGKVGDTLRAALRAYQEAIGAPPDGYPTLALLKKMRERG
ncbi:MAG TPA: lytic murein transglycosylase [Roseiarcus sp.]